MDGDIYSIINMSQHKVMISLQTVTATHLRPVQELKT